MDDILNRKLDDDASSHNYESGKDKAIDSCDDYPSSIRFNFGDIFGGKKDIMIDKIKEEKEVREEESEYEENNPN